MDENGQITNGIIYMEEPVWKYRDFGGSTFKNVTERSIERLGSTFYTSTYICPSCHELLLKSNAGKRVLIRVQGDTRHELTSVFFCPKCNFMFAAAEHNLRLSDGKCWFLDNSDAVAAVVSAVERVAEEVMMPYPCYSGENGTFQHPTQLTREEMLAIGLEHYKGGSYEEALRWCCNAADLGLAAAQYYMAVIQYDEAKKAKEKGDYKPVVYWLLKAARQGYPEAQDQLAYMYEVGLGVEKNNEQARKWWSCAADNGHVPSQGELGRLLMKLGDSIEGKKWLIKAAQQGDERAKAYMSNFGLDNV